MATSVAVEKLDWEGLDILSQSLVCISSGGMGFSADVSLDFTGLGLEMFDNN